MAALTHERVEPTSEAQGNCWSICKFMNTKVCLLAFTTVFFFLSSLYLVPPDNKKQGDAQLPTNTESIINSWLNSSVLILNTWLHLPHVSLSAFLVKMKNFKIVEVDYERLIIMQSPRLTVAGSQLRMSSSEHFCLSWVAERVQSHSSKIKVLWAAPPENLEWAVAFFCLIQKQLKFFHPSINSLHLVQFFQLSTRASF